MTWRTAPSPGSLCGVRVDNRDCALPASDQLIDNDGTPLPPVCPLHRRQQAAALAARHEP